MAHLSHIDSKNRQSGQHTDRTMRLRAKQSGFELLRDDMGGITEGTKGDDAGVEITGEGEGSASSLNK